MLEFRDKNVVLQNGELMPLLGLGCWLGGSQKNEMVKAVETALDLGYRHIDTATVYNNEEEVGLGIQNWLKKSPDNKRQDIFIVTKLPMAGMTPEGVSKFIKLSLSKLKLDYLDLYLIHCPIGFKGGDENNLFPRVDGKLNMDHSTDLIQIWKAMENCVDSGLTKSIGVSNFHIRQLRKINAIARIPPVTNQVEAHVYYQRKRLQEYCKENDMVITAYGNLGSPGREAFNGELGQPPRVLDDPVVRLIAENHSVTSAQVLIRFLMQLQMVPIPKSVNPGRIKSNGDVFSFTLSTLEMEALKSLDKGQEGQTFFLETNLSGSQYHPEACGIPEDI